MPAISLCRRLGSGLERSQYQWLRLEEGFVCGVLAKRLLTRMVVVAC
jgi:hypothetical protein